MNYNNAAQNRAQNQTLADPFCTSIALWVGQRICVCQLASTLAESRHFHPALAAPHKRSWSQQNAQSFLDSRKVHGESDVITTLGEYFLSTHVV